MLLYVLKPDTPHSLSFVFARGRISLFSSLSRILLFLYSGHRELRVFENGVSQTLPVQLGQSCPLFADLCGVLVHVNKFLFAGFLYM